MLRKRSHFSGKSTIDALSGANERMPLQPKQQFEGGSVVVLHDLDGLGITLQQG